jgi:hypothetical protein
VAARNRAAGKGSLFDPWVQAAPVLLDFMAGKEAGVPTILPE